MGEVYYPLRDAFFHIHGWNALEKAMSAKYFLAVLIRELTRAGCKKCRFDDECPEDGVE